MNNEVSKDDPMILPYLKVPCYPKCFLAFLIHKGSSEGIYVVTIWRVYESHDQTTSDVFAFKYIWLYGYNTVC